MIIIKFYIPRSKPAEQPERKPLGRVRVIKRKQISIDVVQETEVQISDVATLVQTRTVAEILTEERSLLEIAEEINRSEYFDCNACGATCYNTSAGIFCMGVPHVCRPTPVSQLVDPLDSVMLCGDPNCACRGGDVA